MDAIIGVMQGRLSSKTDGRYQAFPKYTWRDEFALAVKAGLDRIEWIYDFDTAETNPLSSEDGIREMLELENNHNIQVCSVCADGFMVERLIGADSKVNSETLHKLYQLIGQCRKAGIQYIVLPFVDSSSLSGNAQRQAAINMFNQIEENLEEDILELHVEADFSPEVFSEFINRIQNQAIKVNYDTGNSASLGYNAVQEFKAYGKRIGSVHIKDRILAGGTAPLGQGDVNFPTVLSLLGQYGYQRHFILQAARQLEGSELETVSGYVKYLRKLLHINRNILNIPT